jgi:hypothetical protein
MFLSIRDENTPKTEQRDLSDFVHFVFVDLHLEFVRESLLMRKRFIWAARLLFAALGISLVSCQSGNSTPKDNITDPNSSFSNPTSRTE